MVDVSMCKDEKCPARQKCYRFVATPSTFLQMYGSFGREPDADKCGHFRLVDTKAEAKHLDRVHSD